MRRKIFYALAATALIGLSACSSDDILSLSEDSSLAGGAKAYMTLKLSMADVTRSATNTPSDGDYGTSTSGTETAQSTESSVSRVLVVFTTAANDLTSSNPYPILSAYSSSSLTPTSDGGYEVEIELSVDTDLSEATNMFVFCNPQLEQRYWVSQKEWTAKDVYTVYFERGDYPWIDGEMLMSSAVLSSVNIPQDLSGYSASNPLELGTIKVERSFARFDYKDGSIGGDNTYTILSHDDGQGNAIPQINVELQEIALFDMSRAFFYLRQGATGTTSASSASTTTLLTETSTNWVCDPNFEDKEQATRDESELEIADLFLSPLYKPSTWEWTKLSDLTQESSEGYKIWRYATENCPTSTSNQRRGNTTGVVFKGEITAPEGSDHNFDGISRIYHFEQYLFDSWKDVTTAATKEGADEDTPDLYKAYNEVMKVWTDEKEETDQDVVQAMADAGFTGYAPETGEDGNAHYYVYYYYWNRHNDNANNEDMGTMEFAVVRNNVYGLSVTEINELGHPTPYDDYYYDEASPNSLTRADAIHFYHTPDAYPIVLLDPCEEVTIFNVGLYILPWVADYNADVNFTWLNP